MKGQDLLDKYNISKTKFRSTKLTWKLLESIYNDYLLQIPKLEIAATTIFNVLMKTENVHSVRYRVKDAEHLVAKIIRKKIKEPQWKVTLKNYKSEITDLVGIRALHLFKNDWTNIHNTILETWNLNEDPTLNYREGDSIDIFKQFKNPQFKLKQHPFGYRSIHYIVETSPAKEKYYCEIQVRTIFEEAWSEIDHTIRYPYDMDNQMFNQYLLILNRLAGGADEMGTFIMNLKERDVQNEMKFNQAISEKEKIIRDLEAKIDKLNLDKSVKESLKVDISELKWTDIKPFRQDNELFKVWSNGINSYDSILNSVIVPGSSNFVDNFKLPNTLYNTQDPIVISQNKDWNSTGLNFPQIISTKKNEDK